MSALIARIATTVADLFRVPMPACCPHLDLVDDFPEEVA